MIKPLLLFVAALAFVVSGCACESATPTLPAAGPNAVAFTIRSEPPGATLVVDGIPLGPAPQTVKLNPGPHRVRATMSGYYPAPETKVQVGSGSPTEVVIPLVASH